MAARTILYPMLAMVALTAIVSVIMYRRRVAEMRWRRIAPQSVHASIHCTYNRVIHRLLAFGATAACGRKLNAGSHRSPAVSGRRTLARVASLFVLWTLWGLLAFDLLFRGQG